MKSREKMYSYEWQASKFWIYLENKATIVSDVLMEQEALVDFRNET